MVMATIYWTIFLSFFIYLFSICGFSGHLLPFSYLSHVGWSITKMQTLCFLYVYFVDPPVLGKELHRSEGSEGYVSPASTASRLEEDNEDPQGVCDAGMRKQRGVWHSLR